MIFLYLLLLGCAVKCDDSSYYVVQMPDRTPSQQFKVYWNVPTMQCRSKQIPFDDLYEKYGIIQNTGDSFAGDQLTILYDPGEFPALLKNTSSGQIFFRNGGVPQEGDLITHLNRFKQNVQDSIPDKEFNGVGVIDFESWRPIFRQNFGNLAPYKTVSMDIERNKHWFWPNSWIEAEATRRFEEAGREFMQASIQVAKRMRPQALWGYYGFPYCFNVASNNRKESCADKVPQENSRMTWLWSESTALYPSVYSSKDLTTDELTKLIRGRIKEAVRVRKNGVPVLPYFWYKYRDGGFFKQADLTTALNTFSKSNASGIIIWGSSSDVNTVDKCKALLEYTTNILGPAIAKYTKKNKLSDDITENNDKENNILNDDIENNYSQNSILNDINENNDIDNKPVKEENILLDLILHDCENGCIHNTSNDNEKNRLTTENPFGNNVTNLNTDFLPTSTEKEEEDYSGENIKINTEESTRKDINFNDIETSTNPSTTLNEEYTINDHTSKKYEEPTDLHFSTIKTTQSTNKIAIDYEEESTTEPNIENLDNTNKSTTDFNQFTTNRYRNTESYENTEISSTNNENTTKNLIENEYEEKLNDRKQEFIKENLSNISTTNDEFSYSTTEYEVLKSTTENESYAKSTVLTETESTKTTASENQVVVF